MIPGPSGPLEAVIDEPASSSTPDSDAPRRAVVVFGHPHPQHGGSMHTKTVYQAAKGLVRIGCVVLRFNFRGVGASAGSFDEGRGERDDFRSAIDEAVRRYPDLPVWAAGFSFGSWIALEVGSVDPRISLLIGIAPPVTKPGYTFEHVTATHKPKFFVHGDLDEVTPLKDMWAFYARLVEPKELVVIDGASHLFEGKTPEVGEALEDLLGDFEA
jgi:alpha/beta superfamily hydrolase